MKKYWKDKTWELPNHKIQKIDLIQSQAMRTEGRARTDKTLQRKNGQLRVMTEWDRLKVPSFCLDDGRRRATGMDGWVTRNQ